MNLSMYTEDKMAGPNMLHIQSVAIALYNYVAMGTNPRKITYIFLHI